MVTPKGLSFREVRGMFFDRVEHVTAASWISAVAKIVTSDQPSELYRWLGHVGPMVQSVGANTGDALKAYEFTIATKQFSNGANVLRDDLRRDKTGQIPDRIGELADQAAIFPQQQLVTVLAANGNAFDGSAFFADRSALLTGGRIDNDMAAGDGGIAAVLNVTTATAPTSEEMASAIFAGVTRLLEAKNDAGGWCNYSAREFLILVPLGLFKAALAATTVEFTSAGVSNQLKPLGARGITFRVEVEPGLSNGAVFYIFRTDSPTPAFVWQEEILDGGSPIEFEGLGYDSEYAKLNGQVWFGARRLCAGAYGRPERAVRLTLS